MSRKGLTLIELMVCLGLAILMLIVLMAIYSKFQRDAQSPLAVTELEQTSQRLMRRLERDLSETNLQSIRSLADGGVAMESARDGGDVLHFTNFGTVQWSKFVYYRVVAPGELDYDEEVSGVAVEPSKPPVSMGEPSRHRVLAHDVLSCAVYFTDPNGDHPFTDTQRGEPVCLSLSLRDVNSRTGKASVRRMRAQVKPKN